MTPYTFRTEVVPADRDRVRAIVESTGNFYDHEIEVAVELVDERLAKGLASGYYFVFADRDGATEGYACYGPIACTTGSYDLFWIAVAKSAQGNGLGRLLDSRVCEDVRNLGGRLIIAETSNRADYLPTRKFYEKCEYHLESVIRDFYDLGDDKATYVKRVDT